jgi:hypothetical protein
VLTGDDALSAAAVDGSAKAADSDEAAANAKSASQIFKHIPVIG